MAKSWKVFSRIIEHWDALFDFYKKEYNEKKTFILKQFEDPLTKLKLQFLAYFVQRFNELNLLYQKEETLSYYLCDQLKEFFLSQAKIIIKPKLRKGLSFKTVYEIDLINESTIVDFFMSSQECYCFMKPRH